jgi:hypothetical protein
MALFFQLAKQFSLIVNLLSEGFIRGRVGPECLMPRLRDCSFLFLPWLFCGYLYQNGWGIDYCEAIFIPYNDVRPMCMGNPSAADSARSFRKLCLSLRGWSVAIFWFFRGGWRGLVKR